MLFTVKSFEILPKHNVCGSIYFKLINTLFPNLFFITTCHIKTRPYLEKLYLMKENEEKH